jgi:hypothetical protein
MEAPDWFHRESAGPAVAAVAARCLRDFPPGGRGNNHDRSVSTIVTVAAAGIGAVAGFGGAVWTQWQANRAEARRWKRDRQERQEERGREERGHRLWEKRAAAYEETLRALIQRKHERHNALMGGWMTREAQEQIQKVITEYGGLGHWWDVNVKILAYASDEVMDAVDASAEANQQVMSAFARASSMSRVRGRSASPLDAG